MAFIRYKKRCNKWYAYEVTAIWDKETKKPKQVSTYLGVSDTNGGEYKKPGPRNAVRPEKAIVDCGDSLALFETAKKTGLYDVICNSFADPQSIMALMCYQMIEGSAMYLCEEWLEGNIAQHLFPKADVSSQRISSLIQSLGQERTQRTFFTNYINCFFPNQRGILIDSTALPCAINTDVAAFGYSADGLEKKIGCLMLVDQSTKLPIYFRMVPGDIVDVSTLTTTVEEISRLGLKTESAILDAGYFSEANIRYLCEQNINFVSRMPKSRRIFKELVAEMGPMELGKNAVRYGERVVFVCAKKISLYDNEMHAYVILDPSKRACEINNSMKQSTVEDLSPLEVDEKIQHSGFFILISRSEIDKKDILPTYYTRQMVEQIFGFAKSNNNLLPLRVHSEQSVRGYLMLVFMAVILFAFVRQKLQPTYTVEQALIILRRLKARIYDDEAILQEASKKVRDVCTALDIMMPTKLGI